LENRLIHFVAVEASQWAPRTPPKIILQSTTLSLPADRRLVVLGKRPSVNSSFLRLLAGVSAPTRGKVISEVRLSPIINAAGLFHPYLNGVENIRHFARMLNLNADQLMVAIDAFSGTGRTLGGAAQEEQRDRRREAVMGLLTLLPFDCYLIDELAQFSEAVTRRHLDAVAPRGAGLIFTTTSRRLARRYADCSIVIQDGIVHPFSSVEKAIAFDER
jgi:ABC-type polysaccharide/polyol phosphate transport system ATPase subunit